MGQCLQLLIVQEAIPACTKHLLFLNFRYVCPEPVLVN